MHTTTMKRIASELGVSITTVSKVLNHHADISEATRTRVLAKVEELGYQRNAVARSLSLRRTHTLGIVIPDLMHSFFVEIIAGIEPVASVRGFGLLLCSSSEDPGKERAELEMLRGRQVDGVVLASAHASGNTDMLQQLTTRGTTLVMIDRDDHPSVKCHRVLTDDEQVGQLATSHLLDLGRRAIAHIGGPPIAHAKRRERGWREALQGARHQGRRPTGSSAAASWRAMAIATMKRLLTVRPRVDAVFAANDPSAIGAMKAVWEAGLTRAGRYRGRRRRRHRARRSAARPADDGRLVAARSGTPRRGAAAERPRSRGRRAAARHHPAAPDRPRIVGSGAMNCGFRNPQSAVHNKSAIRNPRSAIRL